MNDCKYDCGLRCQVLKRKECGNCSYYKKAIRIEDIKIPPSFRKKQIERTWGGK